MMLSRSTEHANRAASQRRNREKGEKAEAVLAGHLAGGPRAVAQRLREIEREWNVERTLGTGAAALTLTGALLGAFVDRRWLILPTVVGGLMLQHAAMGWCPPALLLRALGFRSAREIEEERYALKAARGDFVGLIGRKEAALLLEASRR